MTEHTFTYLSDVLARGEFSEWIEVTIEFVTSKGPVYGSPLGPLGFSEVLEAWRIVSAFRSSGEDITTLALSEEARKEISNQMIREERKICGRAV